MSDYAFTYAPGLRRHTWIVRISANDVRNPGLGLEPSDEGKWVVIAGSTYHSFHATREAAEACAKREATR